MMTVRDYNPSKLSNNRASVCEREDWEVDWTYAAFRGLI
jgi:hypothetical protein